MAKMNQKPRLVVLKSLLFILISAALLFLSNFTAPILAQESTTDTSITLETEISVDENSAAGYQFTADDKILLIEPAVCYITTVYNTYVFDPVLARWSEPYPYGPFGGTGFVINPDTGIVVTAGHMVDEIEANYVEMKNAILDQYIFDTYPDDYYDLSDSDWNTIYDGFKVEGENTPEPDREVYVQFNTAIANVPDNPGSNYIRAEVIKLSNRNQNDIAIIRIAPVTGRAFSSAIIGNSSNVEILDSVTVIGYPWTSDIGQDNPLNPTVVKGSISGKPFVSGKSLLQIQAYAVPGNSGSPVLGRDGNVIGILTMGTDNTNNYLRPSNDIKLLLSSESKIGLVDKEWRIGLAMFRQSHFSEAIKHFNAVLNLSSGHLLAQEYKAKAQANMGSDVPLVEATTETAVQATVPETVLQTVAPETAAETTASFTMSLFGLSMTYTLLIIGAAAVILILFIVLLVVLLKRRPKKVGPDIIITKGPVYIASPAPPTTLNEGQEEGNVPAGMIETTGQEMGKEEKEEESKGEITEETETKEGQAGVKEEASEEKIKGKKTRKSKNRPDKKSVIITEVGPKFCPRCGTPTIEGHTFCANCGNKLR
jgi:V8-like Glu-specific endopeptidase